MTDYQPTDGQIEALADDYAGVLGLRDDRHEGDPSDAYRIVVDGVTASPAFQAIIRAAQAEAWDRAVKSAYLHETERHLSIKHESNPYEEESVSPSTGSAMCDTGGCDFAPRGITYTLRDTAPEFDRWLTATIRAAHAEALREAVAEFENHISVAAFDAVSRRDGIAWRDIDSAWEYQGPYMDWLRNRADQIESADA